MKDKIKKLLKEHDVNQEYLAAILGITYQSVSIKVNGHKDFTRTELFKIKLAFNLSDDEFVDIFFTFED